MAAKRVASSSSVFRKVSATGTTNDEENLLRFLHLSDIHFSDCDDSPDTDLDSAVRERMLQDIRKMHDQLGDMDAVLVVGDIAAKGERADYDAAASFLDRTCELVGLAADQVVCVPGNHDIDRNKQGALHEAARFQLRRIEARKISEVLQGLLREEDGRETLLRPLREYNNFALRYGCAIDHELLLWKPKILRLGTREVHLHGVNSAWICDSSDSYERDCDQVVVGLFQLVSIAQESSAISIALCHHPLRWLRDADLIDPWLSKAQIVLTGHEHAAGITASDDQRSVRIASGAVNPDQTQAGWIPAYNIIDLEPISDDRLRVHVYQQSWQSDYAEFGPTEPPSQPFSCELRLAPLQTVPETSDLARSYSDRSGLLVADVSATVAPQPEPFVSDERQMVYRVISASRDLRRRVARELGLLLDSEEIGGLELDKEVLRRALDRGRLAELDRGIINGR